MGTDEPTLGVLAAMPEELGTLRERAPRRRTIQGVEVAEVELAGARAVCAVDGVSKVAAAHAADLLLGEAPLAALLVVGTCGGLRRSLTPGPLVHCTTAVQADLAVRDGREVADDAGLRARWSAVAAGPAGWFLTADRPVQTPWRRLRLARAFAGPCIADMETAATAAMAARAGVPWAALRAVTDGAGFGTALAFRKNFPVQGGRAADTIPALAALFAEGCQKDGTSPPSRSRVDSSPPRSPCNPPASSFGGTSSR